MVVVTLVRLGSFGGVLSDFARKQVRAVKVRIDGNLLKMIGRQGHGGKIKADLSMSEMIDQGFLQRLGQHACAFPKTFLIHSNPSL